MAEKSPDQEGGTDSQSAAQDKRAEKIMYDAQMKEQSSASFLGKLFGASSRLEEAAELFQKAGNIYKANKQSTAAGNAYREAARVFRKLAWNHEAATTLVDAGNLMKDSDSLGAVECYREASGLFMELGRFMVAAKHLQTIAEIYEARAGPGNTEKAVEEYEKAADFFKGENQRSAANKCLLKVAMLSSNLGNYEKGAQIFEDLGNYSAENQLLKYSAKDYYFKAVICHFALMGAERASEAVVRYIEHFPSFEGTREQKVLVKLFEAFNEGDEDRFSESLAEYDSVSRLDDWLTKHFLVVKKKINAAQDDIN